MSLWQSAILGGFAVLLVGPFDVPDPLGAGPQWAWTIVCLGLSAAVLLPEVAARNWPSTRLRLPLLAYLAAAVITALIGVDRPNSVMWLLALAGNVGVLYSVVCIARRLPWTAEAMLCFLIAAITLLLLVATAYHVEVGLLARPKVYPFPRGWSGYPELATLGAVHFALLLAALLTRKRAGEALATALLLALSAAAVALLYFRGGWVAVGAIVLVAGLLTAARGQVVRVLVGLLLGLALTGVLASQIPTLRHLLSGGGGAVVGGQAIEVAPPEMRIRLWQRTLRMIGDHPLTGVGPGNFQQVFEAQYNPELNSDGRRGVHAHNDWLQQFAEVGLVGGSAYVVLWGVVLRLAWTDAWREYRFRAIAALLSLVGVAATNVTTNMFFLTGAGSGRLHSLTWVFFGLVLAAPVREEA